MKLKIGTTLLTAALVAAGSAQAGVILQPTDIAVSEQDPSFSFRTIGRIIDQTGLSATYVSGVTDFDTFTAATTAAGSGSPYPIAGVGGLGSFYFDLGGEYTLTGIASWGQEGGTATVTGYDLYYSDTFGSGGSRTLIGSFSAGASPAAYVGSFSGINARYLELDVTSNEGSSTSSRLNEVAFEAIPEPSTIAFVGLFGGGILFIRRFFLI